MEERNFIDVTSFLLFESIGDSDEAYSDINVYHHSSSQENISTDEADDAQSCSDFMYPNDLSDFDHADQEHVINIDGDYDSHHGYDENRHVMDDDGDGDEEEDDDEIDQVWSSCENLVLQKKSKVCNIDYSKMNDRDKDRHFWETCLAS